MILRVKQDLLPMALVLIFFVTFVSLPARPAKEDPSEIFTDVTDEAGINWKHFNGESEDRFLIEAMGGGVAFLDFDGANKVTR